MVFCVSIVLKGPRRGRETMSRGGVIVIVNAIIWGAVLVGTAHALRGTTAFSEIQLILGGGAAASNLLVAGGALRKPRTKNGSPEK
jgi:hypothetical protein